MVFFLSDLDFEAEVRLGDFMEMTFFMENICSGALPGFTVEEYSQLSEEDKMRNTKLHFRQLHLIWMKVKKGMSFLREENLVTDFGGKKLKLYQTIIREPTIPPPIKKPSKTTDGVRYPNLPCAPALTIRKRKAAEDACDAVMKKKEPVAGCSKNIIYNTPSSDIPKKTIEQHDLERLERRKQEKRRTPFRISDVPDSKFVDDIILENSEDSSISQDSNMAVIVYSTIAPREHMGWSMEDIAFKNVKEMDNEQIGSFMRRPDCPPEVYVEYFQRKREFDSCKLSAGAGENSKEVYLTPYIFKSQRRYPIGLYESMLPPTVREKEKCVVADTRKLLLQKQMFQNLPDSTRVGDKVITVNEFKQNQFSVSVCELGKNAFHGQVIQFTLSEFQTMLSYGPTILAAGIKRLLDRIRDESLRKINKEVNVLIKQVAEIQRQIERKTMENDEEQIVDIRIRKKNLSFELGELYGQVQKKMEVWAQRLTSVDFNLGNLDIIRVSNDENEEDELVVRNEK